MSFEEDVRRIIREELKNLLDSSIKKADVPEYHGLEKPEDSLVALIRSVAEKKAMEAVNAHEDYYDAH